MLSDADAAYVRRAFAPLAEVAGERVDEVAALIAAGRAPAAPYVIDGVPYVPRDHLALVDEAGVDDLRRVFEARYVVAADTYGALAGPDELDAAWEAYMAGVPQAELVEATPENMVRVERLAAAVERLLDDPDPGSWRWANRLRARVEHLAALTRPGTDLDRARNDGPLLRDEYVDEVRARYPEAFAP